MKLQTSVMDKTTNSTPSGWLTTEC